MITPDSFRELAIRHFRFLIERFGYRQVDTTNSAYAVSLLFIGGPIGVEVRLEPREGIFVFLIQMEDDDFPSYLNSRHRWLYLEELLWVRAPEEADTLSAQRQAGLSAEAIENFLAQAAHVLQRHAADLLEGDTESFAAVKRQAEMELRRRAEEKPYPR